METARQDAASSQTILETIADYIDIAQKIEMHNEDYISQKLNDDKEYLDSIRWSHQKFW